MPSRENTHAAIQKVKKEKERVKAKSRQMDASYEVLGVSDRDSEGSEVELETDTDVNGEEVRQGVEKLVVGSSVKAVLSGVGFVMAVVGIWGDGVADVIVVA